MEHLAPLGRLQLDRSGVVDADVEKGLCWRHPFSRQAAPQLLQSCSQPSHANHTPGVAPPLRHIGKTLRNPIALPDHLQGRLNFIAQLSPVTRLDDQPDKGRLTRQDDRMAFVVVQDGVLEMLSKDALAI